MAGIAAPVVAGLAVGIAFIVLFATIGAIALSHYSRYNLGTKYELVPTLSEYFAREPDNAVKLTDEAYYNASLAGGQDIYAYGLIAASDGKKHGVLRIFTYPNEMRVHGISVEWKHNGDAKLLNAGDLLVSGIADSTVPEWRDNIGQSNRNAKMLGWIDANTKCSEDFVKDKIGQQRTLYLSPCEDHFVLVVKVEP